jgi:hypothetical protein
MDLIITNIILNIILLFGGIGGVLYLIRNQDIYIQGLVMTILLYLLFVYSSFFSNSLENPIV